MRNKSPLIYLTTIWIALIWSIGIWWLYIMLNFDSKYKAIYTNPEAFQKFTNMIKWEGSTFIILLLFISLSFMYFFFQDQKRNNSLKSFFASLTHELKTPLTSIQLQAEILRDKIANDNPELIEKYSQRLLEDTDNLNHEFNKLLQLSQIERGTRFNRSEVDLTKFVKSLSKKYEQRNLEISVSSNSDSVGIYCDEMALTVIIRNLFENTIRHSQSNKVDIKILDNQDDITLTYNDHGKEFTGDQYKLGKLFYKHDSPKGSGIGLYLINRLMQANEGRLNISVEKNLVFDLVFKKII